MYELHKSINAGRSDSAAAFRLLADLQYRAGHVTAAAKTLAKSSSMTAPERRPVAAAEIGISCYPIIFESGRISRARNVLETSRQTFGTLGDSVRRCEALLAQGTVETFTGSLADCEETLNEALSLAENNEGSDLQVARASLGLAVVTLFQNDLSRYQRLRARAREYTEAEEGPVTAGLNFVGAIQRYFAEERYGEAFTLAEAAAVSFARRHNPLATPAATLASWAALAEGNLSLCEEIIEHPDLQRRARESPVFSAAYHRTVGALLWARRERDPALKYLRAAVAGSREFGLWLIGGICHLDLAAASAGDDREKHRRRAVWLFKRNGATLLARKAERLPPGEARGKARHKKTLT